MPSVSVAEKVELVAVLAMPALAAWLAPRPGLSLELGTLVGGAALLMLVQGFFRDLWLLRQARRQPATPAREAQCMCVESALGMTGIVAGIGLAGFGLGHPLTLSPTLLAAAIGGTMLAGFLLKDFVFEWNPWRIYREKDHAQVIFRSRK